MSRSGYSFDLDELEPGRWRGQVASAIKGKRGQRFLRDLLAALESMSEKLLITHELEDGEGSVCAIGALGKARGIDLNKIDAEEPEDVAAAFGIARQLAQEIVFQNDDNGPYGETPEDRYTRIVRWVKRHIHE